LRTLSMMSAKMAGRLRIRLDGAERHSRLRWPPFSA